MGLERDLSNKSVLLCAPTGKAAFNINGSTVHSTFHLPLNQSELQELSSDISNTIASELSELQVVIIDEISMVSSTVFLWIDQRLREIFGTNAAFSGRHVLILGDFWQIPPVHDSPIYDPFKRDPSKRLRRFDIWHSFKVHYLTTIMQQRDDAAFAIALNNLAKGVMNTTDIELLSSRTFKDLPTDAYHDGVNSVHLFATNKDVNNCNSTILAQFRTEKHLSTAFDLI